MNLIANAIAQALTDIEPFSRLILKRPLRPYQLEPARAAIESVLKRDGEQYVWRFPRQSGKNETIAHVHAYLLFLYQRVKGASIIHTAPTFDPQAHNAQLRILEITGDNPFFSKFKSGDGVLTLGKCNITFLSGMARDKPIVGATASLLLSKDECQDLDETYIERTFDPMTANTNAPHIHTGTARHDSTYLARKRQELETKTAKDHKRRVFIINWHDVAAVNPAYGAAVQDLIARKGAMHPSVLTEYENVETARTGRLFDDRRITLIFNTRARRTFGPDPAARGVYVATIDVGGTDLQPDVTREHDMTVLTIHQVTSAPLVPAATPAAPPADTTAPPVIPSVLARNLSVTPSNPPLVPDHSRPVAIADTTSRETSAPDALADLQTYTLANSAGLNHFTTIEHFSMQGANVLDDSHPRRRLFTILDLWHPVRIIVDNSGIGSGLSSALINRYRQRVIPFIFTATSKTDLLNEWLALIETGRYHHYDSPNCNGHCDLDHARFRRQLEKCEHELHANHIEWSIPAHVSWRNPVTLQDEPLHDDHLMSTALVAVLSDADLRPREATSTPAQSRARAHSRDRERILSDDD